MKLGEATPRRDAPRDNRFEGAGRGQRAPQRPAAPAPQGSAMASAFAKLQGLRK
jgi:protein Tex